MKTLAALIDRFFNWVAPIHMLDVLAANDLAELEEHVEFLEPDDLWAAMARHRLSAGTGRAQPNVPPTFEELRTLHTPLGAGGLLLHAAVLRKSR